MKRGPGGGLVVTPPSIEPIVRAATVFLEHRGITPADLIAVRRDLESEAVALATERATPPTSTGSGASSTQTSRPASRARSTTISTSDIAELTGNPAIAVFVRVLVQLTRAHAVVPGRRSPRRVAINSETDHAQRAIVDAIAQRDAALARRR